LPNRIVDPAVKLLPPIVTKVPPSIDPLFGETAEISGLGVGETLSEKPVEREAALESWTLVMKENVPAQVGVPEMVPVVGFSVRPVGSVPLVFTQE
jgi:hypothetical protein